MDRLRGWAGAPSTMNCMGWREGCAGLSIGWGAQAGKELRRGRLFVPANLLPHGSLWGTAPATNDTHTRASASADACEQKFALGVYTGEQVGVFVVSWLSCAGRSTPGS